MFHFPASTSYDRRKLGDLRLVATLDLIFDRDSDDTNGMVICEYSDY